MTQPTGQPAEHCGHQQDHVIGQPTECVLRPGHSGSHADQTGMRWWKRMPNPAQPQQAECLLDSCTQACTTECREAINRAWTSLRGAMAEDAQPRHTVDTELRHLRIAQAGHDLALQAACRKTQEQRERADKAAAEVERMKLLVAASSEDGQAVRMAVQYAERAIENGERAEKAEAALAASESKRQALMRAHVALALQAGRDQAAVLGVRVFHERDPEADYCVVCSNHGDITWPCATVAVLDQHGQTPA